MSSICDVECYKRSICHDYIYIESERDMNVYMYGNGNATAGTCSLDFASVCVLIMNSVENSQMKLFNEI